MKRGGPKPDHCLLSTKFHTHVVLSVDSVLSGHDVCTDIVTSCEVPLSMVRHWEPCLHSLLDCDTSDTMNS